MKEKKHISGGSVLAENVESSWITSLTRETKRNREEETGLVNDQRKVGKNFSLRNKSYTHGHYGNLV